MSEQINEQLMDQLLGLPYEQRREVVDRLIESLHPPGEELTPEEWNAAWTPELNRRLAELESGAVQGIPASEVFAEIDERRRAREQH